MTSVVPAAVQSGSGLLRPRDQAYLAAKGYDWSVTVETQMVCIVIAGYQLPPGLQPDAVDLLLRLPAGFPDIAPDMFWCDPPVINGGQVIAATEVREQHLGRTWQRWSRHLAAGQWRPGVDDLATFLTVVRRCLDEAAGTAP